MLIALDDVFFLNDTTVEISPEVDQCWPTTTNAPAIHDPLFGQRCRGDQPGLAQARQELAPEHLGQSFVVEPRFSISPTFLMETIRLSD